MLLLMPCNNVVSICYVFFVTVCYFKHCFVMNYLSRGSFRNNHVVSSRGSGKVYVCIPYPPHTLPSVITQGMLLLLTSLLM